MLALASAEAALSATQEQKLTNICDIIRHPAIYDGKRVKFIGFRVPEIEMLQVTGPGCENQLITIGDDVKGRFKLSSTERKGLKWFAPSAVFSGKVRVYKNITPFLFLDNGVISSSRLREFPSSLSKDLP